MVDHPVMPPSGACQPGDEPQGEREDCAEELVAIERLTAGQAFHKTVQSAFLTGLAGASGFRERQWRLVRGGRGRVDLAVEGDGDEQMLVVIEIKGADRDAIPADRVMRNHRQPGRLAGEDRPEADEESDQRHTGLRTAPARTASSTSA